MSAVDDVKEILETRREFTFEVPGSNDPQQFYIGTPTGEDIRKADWEYSKIYAQAITDKLLTQSQMTDALKDAGIISSEYEQDVEKARINLGAELFRLENLMDDASDDEKESTAREVGRLRDELFLLNQRVNGPMANTCENLAEDARTDFLTSRIVEKPDGNDVWGDYEEYRLDENTAFTVRARFEVMLWMQGLESNFLENTPEQKTLRSIALTQLEEEAAKEAAPDLPEVEVETIELPDAPVVEEAVEEVVEKPVAAPKKTRGRPKGSKNKSKPKPKPKTPKVD